MQVQVTVIDINKRAVLESFIRDDGQMVKTRTGLHKVPAVIKETKVFETLGDTKMVVTASPVEVPDIPKPLLRLVNSNDKQWGRNGYNWLASCRAAHGGSEVDRVREYARKVLFSWGQNPVGLERPALKKMLDELDGIKKVVAINAAKRKKKAIAGGAITVSEIA